MRILIGEDDPVSRRVLEEFLTKWGYEVTVTQDGAWQALQEDNAPRLAILDWMMPVMDGVEVCRQVRRCNSEPYTYILLLTAKGQKTDIVEGIEAGADDYLTKPFDAGELRARLRAGRRILALQGALLSARDALRFQATHDPLTGLWNRLATLESLRRELGRGEREEFPVGVVMADLDHFKQINDVHGHATGDAVLREVAGRLRDSVRDYDTVGRYGGEEFLIVFPSCDLTLAARQAERIRNSFHATPLDLPDGEFLQTLSLGVASIGPQPSPASVDDLIQIADQALYRAKARGRNCVETVSEDELSHVHSGSAYAGKGRTKKHNGGR